MGTNTERNKRKRDRQQANLEALEAEAQAERAALAPFDDAVDAARRDLRLFINDGDSDLAADKVEAFIDAKIRLAAFRLGLDPDKVW